MTHYEEMKNKRFVDKYGNVYLMDDDGDWEVSKYDEYLNFLNIVTLPWDVIKVLIETSTIYEES